MDLVQVARVTVSTRVLVLQKAPTNVGAASCTIELGDQHPSLSEPLLVRRAGAHSVAHDTIHIDGV